MVELYATIAGKKSWREAPTIFCPAIVAYNSHLFISMMLIRIIISCIRLLFIQVIIQNLKRRLSTYFGIDISFSMNC